MLLLHLSSPEWYHFVLGFTQGHGEAKISSFCFSYYEGNEEAEFVANVKVKTNQSTKIITQVQKIRKIVLYLLNYSSTANSIILLPLFVINTILSVFHTNLSLHVFYILSCCFHMSHLYIFFLAEQSTWSKSTSLDLVFEDLLFPVLLLCPIKLFRKLAR